MSRKQLIGIKIDRDNFNETLNYFKSLNWELDADEMSLDEALSRDLNILCQSPYLDETKKWIEKRNRGINKLLFCHIESHIVNQYITIKHTLS